MLRCSRWPRRRGPRRRGSAGRFGIGGPESQQRSGLAWGGRRRVWIAARFAEPGERVSPPSWIEGVYSLLVSVGVLLVLGLYPAVAGASRADPRRTALDVAATLAPLLPLLAVAGFFTRYEVAALLRAALVLPVAGGLAVLAVRLMGTGKLAPRAFAAIFLALAGGVPALRFLLVEALGRDVAPALAFASPLELPVALLELAPPPPAGLALEDLRPAGEGPPPPRGPRVVRLESPTGGAFRLGRPVALDVTVGGPEGGGPFEGVVVEGAEGARSAAPVSIPARGEARVRLFPFFQKPKVELAIGLDLGRASALDEPWRAPLAPLPPEAERPEWRRIAPSELLVAAVGEGALAAFERELARRIPGSVEVVPLAALPPSLGELAAFDLLYVETETAASGSAAVQAFAAAGASVAVRGAPQPPPASAALRAAVERRRSGLAVLPPDPTLDPLAYGLFEAARWPEAWVARGGAAALGSALALALAAILAPARRRRAVLAALGPVAAAAVLLLVLPGSRVVLAERSAVRTRAGASFAAERVYVQVATLSRRERVKGLALPAGAEPFAAILYDRPDPAHFAILRSPGAPDRVTGLALGRGQRRIFAGDRPVALAGPIEANVPRPGEVRVLNRTGRDFAGGALVLRGGREVVPLAGALEDGAAASLDVGIAAAPPRTPRMPLDAYLARLDAEGPVGYARSSALSYLLRGAPAEPVLCLFEAERDATWLVEGVPVE